MSKPAGAHDPFGVEVRRLAHQHGKSIRAVANGAEVDPSYLHHVLKGNRAASEKLLLSIASYFELPPEYFREYRELVVMRHVRGDAAMLDRFYRVVTRGA